MWSSSNAISHKSLEEEDATPFISVRGLTGRRALFFTLPLSHLLFTLPFFFSFFFSCSCLMFVFCVCFAWRRGLDLYRTKQKRRTEQHESFSLDFRKHAGKVVLAKMCNTLGGVCTRNVKIIPSSSSSLTCPSAAVNRRPWVRRLSRSSTRTVAQGMYSLNNELTCARANIMQRGKTFRLYWYYTLLFLE